MAPTDLNLHRAHAWFSGNKPLASFFKSRRGSSAHGGALAASKVACTADRGAVGVGVADSFQNGEGASFHFFGIVSARHRRLELNIMLNTTVAHCQTPATAPVDAIDAPAQLHSAPSEVLTIVDLTCLLRRSRSWIYDKSNPRSPRFDAAFPRPRRLSPGLRAPNVWRLHEVQVWLDSRPYAR